ncbi:MAG: rane-associated zinc metalloprotease [Gemmatimonadetes bacterium]|nr:rane-associated zinc metalloprotease [Gemmatimonadota bacterium]
MLAYIAPIVVFGLVIFVHELGHFIAAKLTGVYAPRFSIGFGPALIRHRHGETEYVLAALPLGGYVRMASRHDAEAAMIEGGSEESSALKPDDAGYDPNAMMPFGPRPVPEDRWFESKSLAARLFIMIAGVTMNFLLAFIVLTLLGLTYGEVVVATREVGAVHVAPNAPALASLRAGDTITAINGTPVRNWNEVRDEIDKVPAGTLAITTQHGDVRVPVGGANEPPAKDVGAAIDFFIPPIIGDMLPGSAGARAGLRGGDSIVTINDLPVTSWSQLQERVTPSAGKEVPFEVRRGGRTLRFVVTPEPMPQKDPVTKITTQVGKIGATPADFSSRQPMGLREATVEGARRTWVTATGIVDIVRGLLTREVSVRQLGGPIAITRASVAAARSGLETLFSLIAILSVNVAVLNLLPIPILDGGQILINIAESVKGGPFSARTREYVLRAGLVLILLIFAMSTYNDVVSGVKDAIAKLFG